MRIAMLATSRHPVREPYAGGQESHTAVLAKGLRELGHHVRLYARAGTDPGLADEIVPYPDLPPLSAVAAVDPALPEPEFLRDHAAFLAAVRDLLARPDVDVVHNQSLHFLPLALSEVLPAPLVTTLHTPPFPWMELGIALAGPRAAYVCVSAASAADWTTLPRPPQVVPNGVSDDDGGPGPGGEDLVWVGRLTAVKGADLAIRAARAAGRRLALVGPVSDPEWYAHAVAPELGRDVEHHGHLAHADIARLVRASAATLVTPRWDEPFGLVAAESTVWGTPVVAIDRGGLREVVREGTGVLVDDRGASEAAVVTRLRDGVQQAVSLPRPEVRRRALAHLGADVMVERYLQVYRDLQARPEVKAHPVALSGVLS
ncbi:glycosyltransferase [Serinicoccus sp. LYQ131]|uniref:glycosyltransferase n=1 Tax=Serinicoccus sp. LYQ131 TaxID=3378797 RepID=UPI003851D515